MSLKCTQLPLLREARLTYALLSMLWRRNGYFACKGWFDSYLLRRPVDREGRPLPWLTYPAIDFLGPRLTRHMRVFEYGSGNSTLFFAARVHTVDSVEHDPAWLAQLQTQCPPNVVLYFRSLENGERYTLAPLDTGGGYQVILVDGRRRAQCLRCSIDALASGGVIILDDAEREEYAAALADILLKGFRRLEFRGMAPGNYTEKCTMVLYRNGNCLGI